MKSFPFDSQITGVDEQGFPIYDRAADSSVLASMLGRFFSNGIVRDDAGTLGFYVTPGAAALTTQVSPGYVIIEGRCGELETDDDRTFTHTAPHSAYDRIDRIILRKSLELSERSVSLYMKTGTPSASPAAPALTRNSSVWELAVADVLVKRNVNAITQAVITDNRLNNNLCGVSEIPMKVFNTTALYSQVQSDLAQFKANEQVAFAEWVETIKATLDENAAGRLLNMIHALQTRASSLEDYVALLKNTMNVSSAGIDMKGKYIDNALFR